jgi:uncharacterized protein YbjQ (UPF0145 family)
MSEYEDNMEEMKKNIKEYRDAERSEALERIKEATFENTLRAEGVVCVKTKTSSTNAEETAIYRDNT